MLSHSRRDVCITITGGMLASCPSAHATTTNARNLVSQGMTKFAKNDVEGSIKDFDRCCPKSRDQESSLPW
jgi:hypothetical protein